MKVIILEVEPQEVRPVLNSLFGRNECPMAGGGIMVEIGRVDLGAQNQGGLASMLAGLRSTMENAGKVAGVPGGGGYSEVKPPEPPPPPPPPPPKTNKNKGGK